MVGGGGRRRRGGRASGGGDGEAVAAVMARDGCEAALVGALRRQADKAKAALAAVDAFKASMRRYQAADGVDKKSGS